MQVVIIGAGTVGTSIAELLCHEGHSVTVIDNDEEKTKRIYNELDVRTVLGQGSQTSILFQADTATADVVLAVTGNDEVNIVAASIARGMGAKRSVARVYAPVFRDLSTFDYEAHFGINRLLSLEHLTAMELARAIRNPTSLFVENFARGELEIQEVTVSAKSAFVDKSIRDMALPSKIRLGSISRNEKTWIASADDELKAGDRLGIIGRTEDIENVKTLFQKTVAPKRRIMIAGGGETGYHLAKVLDERRFSVLLMESDLNRCEKLAARLPHVTVIQCDATSRNVLEEERVASADVFVACTGDDENNMVAGVEAKELGAKQILAIVGRSDYGNIISKLGIDFAVSEREVMAKQINGYLDEGPIIAKSCIAGGTVNVIEADIIGEAPITGKPLAELDLPGKTLIAAVSRQGFSYVPGASSKLEDGDTVIALAETNSLSALKKMFNGPKNSQ